MGSSSKKQKTGFRYGFDIHMGLGMPLDEICEIQASDKSAWKGSVTTNGQIRINAPDLFGGDKGEGGIDGTLDVMFGEENQTPVAKLVAMLSQLGGIVPAFRGQTTAFFSGLVTSNNPYPKPWKFLRRGGNRLWAPDSAWYPEKQFIWLAGGQIKAMNPIHMLYLIYTGKRFRGRPRALMDDAAWRAAADTAYAEGLGLCLEWKRSDSFKTFRDTILSHISAEIFLNRRQALISIRLLRDDYDVDDLPLFDEDSGLLDIIRDESSSNDNSSVPSILVVKYVDAIDGATKQVKAVNSAVAGRDGGQTVQTKDYPGAPTGDIAGRLCLRDLRLATAGLKRFKVVLDRRGRDLTPGAPFRVRSTRRGIGEIVLRVGRFEDGTLDDGRVQITALQDVFGLPAASFVAVPPAGWAPPDRTPRAVTIRRAFELPYHALVGSVDPANLQQLGTSATFAATVGAAPTSLALSYDLTDRVGTSGTFVEKDTGDWCPTGLLVGALARELGPSSTMVTSFSRLEDVVVGSAAMVDDEIVRVDAINYDTGALTLARACGDTIPAVHAAGARIWFYDGFEAIDQTTYSQGVSLQLQLLTNTSQGQLDPSLAATDTLSLQGRQGRPYPPAQVKVNSSYLPSTVSGDVVLTYVHRDRLGQADQLIDATVGSIGPESGTTYSARLLRVDTGAVLDSQSAVSATSITLSTDYVGQVQAELWSVRGALASLQTWRHTFNHTLAVSLVGTSTLLHVTATSTTVAIPAGAAAGDLLLACIFYRDTLTPPAGWTLVASVMQTGTPNQWTAIYKRTAVAGDAGSNTVWSQATSQRMACQILALHGESALSVLSSATAHVDGTEDNVLSIAPLTAPSGTKMAITCASSQLGVTAGTSTIAISTGWTQTSPSSSTDTTNALRMGVAYRSAAPEDAVSGSFTMNISASNNSSSSVTVTIG
ncbi:phage tail protein [Pseudomonas knackmussii]|uniref:phage tail protein n=1 Tax=Pseudomonas knackmussii TaxID=65741 RepID=UPI003F49FE7E